MQIGLGSYACAWAIGVPGYQVAKPMDVFAFANLAKDLGFSLVQIADNLPLHVLSASERQRLLEHVKKLNLSVEVGTRGIQSEHLKTYLQLAKTFNSRILRVVVDSQHHHPTPDEVIRLVAEVLADFESANIILAVENHDRFLVKHSLTLSRRSRVLTSVFA